MTIIKGIVLPTHLFYDDDIMMFYQANKRDVHYIMKIFNDYGSTLGYIINKENSKFYIRVMSLQRFCNIQTWLSFLQDRIMSYYPGRLMFKEKPKHIHFQRIAHKIFSKLIKSIDQSMLVYSLHIYRWLAKVLTQLDTWFRKIMWNGDILTQQICIVA